MKIKYILPLFLVSFFTGCLSEDEILESITGGAIEIQDGVYKTSCVADGGASSITYLEISGDATQRVLGVEIYANDETCSVLTDDGSGDEDTATVELAKLNFGNNTSFLTQDSPSTGVNKVPYHVDGADLYLGVEVDDENESSPESLFEDFIEDPQTNAAYIFTRVVE